MFDLLVIILFIWLSIKFLCVALKITWGVAKLIASLLFIIALPALVVCVLFASGVILIFPVALLAIAIGVLSSGN